MLFDARLSGHARLLYVQLSHYAWRNPTPGAGPTQEEIATNLGRRARQIRNYLVELETRWLLDRIERGQGQPLEYVLYEPTPDYLERDPRPARAPKRAVENLVETDVEDEGSSATDCRPSSAMDRRPARQWTAEPCVKEGSEDVEVQERERVSGSRTLREEAEPIRDAIDQSLRRAQPFSQDTQTEEAA